MCFVAYKTTSRKHRFNVLFFSTSKHEYSLSNFLLQSSTPEKKLMQHLKEDHLSSSNFFVCKIYNCQRLYSSIRSFGKHLARWHPDCIFESFSDFTYSLSKKSEASSINETENEDIFDSYLSFDRIKLSNESSFAKNMMHFCLKYKKNIFYLIPPTLASWKKL